MELPLWKAIRCGRICVGDSSLVAQNDKRAARMDKRAAQNDKRALWKDKPKRLMKDKNYVIKFTAASSREMKAAFRR